MRTRDHLTTLALLMALLVGCASGPGARPGFDLPAADPEPPPPWSLPVPDYLLTPEEELPKGVGLDSTPADITIADMAGRWMVDDLGTDAAGPPYPDPKMGPIRYLTDIYTDGSITTPTGHGATASCNGTSRLEGQIWFAEIESRSGCNTYRGRNRVGIVELEIPIWGNERRRIVAGDKSQARWTLTPDGGETQVWETVLDYLSREVDR